MDSQTQEISPAQQCRYYQGGVAVGMMYGMIIADEYHRKFRNQSRPTGA